MKRGIRNVLGVPRHIRSGDQQCAERVPATCLRGTCNGLVVSAVCSGETRFEFGGEGGYPKQEFL